jgi:polysaccharide export outer membrane protein
MGSTLILLAVGWVVVAGGCGVQPKRAPGGPTLGRAVLPDPPLSQEYRIGPEDMLDVVVWKNPDLSKPVAVRPDGMITLPLIGELRAAGLTPTQVRSEIKTRLEKYKDVAEVSVTVSDVRSYNLYILGEVKTPGRYQVKSATTVLQALALAGGFTPWADTGDIVVVRRDPHGKEQRLRVRYKDLVRRDDVNLFPGDTVIVP